MDNFFERLDAALGSLVGFLWGPPLVTLLVGGGLFFLLYSRLLPYRHLPDGVRLCRVVVQETPNNSVEYTGPEEAEAS